MVKGGDVLTGGVDAATLAQEIATPYHHFRVVRPRETIEVFRVIAGRSGSREGGRRGPRTLPGPPRSAPNQVYYPAALSTITRPRPRLTK